MEGTAMACRCRPSPPPRNFTSAEAWKNGKKPTQIFKTLKEGLPPSAMASYATCCGRSLGIGALHRDD
jgi:hypothetical protein